MERIKFTAAASAGMEAFPPSNDTLVFKGRFDVECRDAEGNLLWEEHFPNTVATVGINLLLDTGLAGAGYTVTGPFMGLISSVSFTGTSATDTMASHPGWLEAGTSNAPTFSGNRQTCVWSAASAAAKSLSSPLAFTMTGSGTLEGCFIVYGSGAVNTILSSAGILFSAGVFSGGAQPVASTNVVNVSYTITG
jgi:hypothetical protein